MARFRQVKFYKPDRRPVLVFAAVIIFVAVFLIYLITVRRDWNTIPGKYTANFSPGGRWMFDVQIDLWIQPDGFAEIASGDPKDEWRRANGKWSVQGNELRFEITTNDIRGKVYRDEDQCFIKATHVFHIAPAGLTLVGWEDEKGLHLYRRLRADGDMSLTYVR